MKIIIVGGGIVGSTLTKYLSDEGHSITVIDNNQELIQDYVNRYDISGVCGNGVINTIQKEAGVESCDMFISVTPRDEENILCCLVAKMLGAKNTIARVRDPEYAEQSKFMREFLGISMMVNPEQEAADAISRLLRFSTAIKVECFARGKVDLVAFEVEQGSVLNNLAIKKLHNLYDKSLLICAVERNDEVIIPGGDTVIQAGDIISVISTPQHIAGFFKAIKVDSREAKRVLIIGGDRTVYYVAKRLAEVGINTKVIEKDIGRCRDLAEMLDGVTVVHGDGSDQRVLSDEGIDTVDAVIALADSDEQNIVTALYCRKRKVSQIITQIDNDAYKELIDDLNLDAVVSPKEVTASRIIRYARALYEPKGTSVINMFRIAGDKAEALEFNVGDSAELVGKKVKDIKFISDLLLGCIIRGNEIIIAGGDTVIEADDKIIVIVSGHHPAVVEDILK